jgi:hypothetical protein
VAGLRRRRGSWDPEAVYHLRGVPDALNGMTVDTSSVGRRIVTGLKEHRSQRHVIADPGATDEQWARSTDLPPRDAQGPSSDTVAGSSAPS